ncbi:MAG TPA: ferredoxin [Mycobacteriales bacterium]|nr:ferredoxin [Mycobacteriales bacterium]
MRALVDTRICQGHNLCAAAAPEVFAPDEDDGHAIVTLDLIPAEFEESVRKAAANCPESAIEVLDD